MRHESRFALQFASRMVLSWGNAAWWAWSTRGCRRGGTGQAEVGAGAAERRAEEHRQQPCSVWYISLPAGVTGTAGSQLQHKADLPETAQPKDHTGHAFVCCFSSAAAGNPLPIYPWGAAGLAWECCWQPLIYNRIGVAGNIFFPSA